MWKVISEFDPEDYFSKGAVGLLLLFLVPIVIAWAPFYGVFCLFDAMKPTKGTN